LQSLLKKPGLIRQKLEATSLSVYKLPIMP